MAKYNEIMARILVTTEMRQRVLENIEFRREKYLNKKSKTLKLLRWMPGIAAASLALIVGMQMYQTHRPIDDPDQSMVAEMYGTKEYSSLEELEIASGFSMPKIHDAIPFEVKETAYIDSFGIARVNYYGTGGELISIAKAKDDGTDISGDYNEYETVTEMTIENCSVAMKGNDGTFSLAVWTMNEFSYAVSSSFGMTKYDMQLLIKEICISGKNE